MCYLLESNRLRRGHMGTLKDFFCFIIENSGY